MLVVGAFAMTLLAGAPRWPTARAWQASVLMRARMTEAGAASRPYAVVAARRLSRTALLAVVVLAATGAANAWTFVGSVGGLLGTPYGRLLLLKLSVLAPILALAIANRRRLLPALSGDAVRVGRPALRMLAGFVTIEAVLALALLAVVAAMGVTAPARHEQPTWPLPFRLTLATIDGAGARLPVLIGSQVVVLGLVGLAIAALVSAGRRLIVVVALALLVTGLALAVPPLAVDAYPTTYRRSDVP